jgi:hypothetical protein
MQANINTFLSSIIVIKNEIIFCFQKRNEWGFLREKWGWCLREPQTPANGPQAPKNPLHEKGVFESLRHRLMDLSHRKTRSLSLSKVLPEVLEGAP